LKIILTNDDGIDAPGLGALSQNKYSFRNEGSNFIYEGTIHERPRDPGKDVAVCFGGKISISKLTIQAAVKDLLQE
jgi:5'-nucleotidase